MELEEYSKLKPGTPVEIDIYKIEEIIGSLKKIKKTDGYRVVGTYLGKNQISIPLVSCPHEIILRNIDHEFINNVNHVNNMDVFRIHKEDFAELFICDEPAKLNYNNDSILLIYNDNNHVNDEVKVTDSEYARFCYFEPDLSSYYFKIKFINGYNIATPDDIKIHRYVINFYCKSGLYNGSIPADRVYLLSKDSILCDLNVPNGKISFVIERNKKDDGELAPSSYFIVTATGINLGGDSHD